MHEWVERMHIPSKLIGIRQTKLTLFASVGQSKQDRSIRTAREDRGSVFQKYYLVRF